VVLIRFVAQPVLDGSNVIDPDCRPFQMHHQEIRMVASSHSATHDTGITGVSNERRTIEGFRKLKSRKFFACAAWAVEEIGVGETCAFKYLLEKANGMFLANNGTKSHRDSYGELK
jgi:hypothetical protein